MSRSSEEQVNAELNLWKKKLQGFWQEIDGAEEMQIADMAVSDLRDLAYDMEDVWDEFAYQVMRRNLTAAEADEPSGKLCKFVPPCCTTFDPSCFVRLVKLRPKNGEVISRLRDILPRKGGFGLGKVSGVSTWQRLPYTIPAAYLSLVFGRDEDKEVIFDLLDGFGFGIISIVGMGGVGKKILVYSRYIAKRFALKVRFNRRDWSKEIRY